MGDIEPAVAALITPLQESGLGHLAQTILVRISDADARVTQGVETDEGTVGSEEHDDPFHPPDDESPRDRAYRHVQIADHVISSIMEREIAVTDRLRALRDVYRDQRPGERRFETVYVVEPHETIDGERREDLLSAYRTEHIRAFLKAWRRGVEVTTTMLDRDAPR